MAKYEKNCWVSALQGVARVIASVDVHVEEYSSAYISGKKNVGDYLHTLVVYKVLCNYDGVIRKRFKSDSSNQSLISLANERSLELIDKIQKKEQYKFLAKRS